MDVMPVPFVSPSSFFESFPMEILCAFLCGPRATAFWLWQSCLDIDRLLMNLHSLVSAFFQRQTGKETLSMLLGMAVLMRTQLPLLSAWVSRQRATVCQTQGFPGGVALLGRLARNQQRLYLREAHNQMKSLIFSPCIFLVEFNKLTEFILPWSSKYGLCFSDGRCAMLCLCLSFFNYFYFNFEANISDFLSFTLALTLKLFRLKIMKSETGKYRRWEYF